MENDKCQMTNDQWIFCLIGCNTINFSLMPERSTLYICYFGVREPLVRTQVLPYLRELKKIEGLRITLLTFEPEMRARWSAAEVEEEKRRLAAQGIRWEMLAYHKRPSVLATAYDVLSGAWFVFRNLQRESTNILHCRVHVPALMGAIGRKLARHKPKLIFDIRGFMPEEYTDAGVWPEGGWLYRVAKRIEKWLIREADAFIVLTEKARDILFPESRASGKDSLGRPVEVIPCCVDMSGFRIVDDQRRAEARRRLGVENRFVIAYVGSFGGWYLTDSMLEFFAEARKKDPRTFVMILTQRGDDIGSRLEKLGFGTQDYFVGTVAPTEISDYLAAGDVALSFIKSCYSKQSSSPTKIAEYLACGLPLVCNKGVGDIDELLLTDRVGVLLDDFTADAYAKALREVLALTNGDADRSRFRQSAQKRFDLETVGGKKYRSVYSRVLMK